MISSAERQLRVPAPAPIKRYLAKAWDATQKQLKRKYVALHLLLLKAVVFYEGLCCKGLDVFPDQ